MINPQTAKIKQQAVDEMIMQQMHFSLQDGNIISLLAETLVFYSNAFKF